MLYYNGESPTSRSMLDERQIFFQVFFQRNDLEYIQLHGVWIALQDSWSMGQTHDTSCIGTVCLLRRSKTRRQWAGKALLVSAHSPRYSCASKAC